MACYNPWTPAPNSASWTRLMVCGKCPGCLLKRSRDWAIRITHEQQLHKHSCFVTLTYSEKNVPEHGHLVHRDFQLFMKKLRAKTSDHNDLQSTTEPTNGNPLCTRDTTEKQDMNILTEKTKNIRYYMAGEYGEKNNRPHYHAALFNIDFKDKTLIKTTESGEKIYKSPTLEKIWTRGYSSIGTLTFASAAYIARYMTNAAPAANTLITPDGEMITRPPEYNRMSLNPAIGKQWLKKYRPDIYPHGYAVIQGHKAQPPRYYDLEYKKTNPKAFARLQKEREELARKNFPETKNARLQARETVERAKMKQLKRGKI